MGISPSADVRPLPALKTFEAMDIKTWHTKVREFETSSPHFGWSINLALYAKLFELTDEDAAQSWGIWDIDEVDKQSVLEIFCGICIISAASFKDKVHALLSLFDFENKSCVKMKAFSLACKTVNKSICKMTLQKYPTEKLMSAIVKNSFKSADSVSNFRKSLDAASLLRWAYLCAESYYIFSHWNTLDAKHAKEVHAAGVREMAGKTSSIYFQIPLTASHKQRQRQKQLFFHLRSPKLKQQNKSTERRSGSDSRALSKSESSKPGGTSPGPGHRKAKLIKTSMASAITRKKYRQYTTSEILGNFEEILKTGLHVLAECRITSNTRLSASFMVKDVLTLKHKFDAIDADGNGSIDLGEFVSAFPDAFGGGHATRIFREMDTDRSGNIDFSELLSVLYPMASGKDKTLIISWLRHNTVDEHKIQMLRGLFQTLSDFKRCELDTLAPRREMFAILVVSESFFPFTLNIRSEQIVDDEEYISLDQLIVMLFDKEHKELVPQMLKWIAPRKLTEKQSKDLQLLFEQYDEDNSGEINLKEFISASQRFGVKEEVVKTSFYCMDKDNTDSITFKEFQQFFREVWDVGFASNTDK